MGILGAVIIIALEVGYDGGICRVKTLALSNVTHLNTLFDFYVVRSQDVRLVRPAGDLNG